METSSERRKRKLEWVVANKGGLAAVAKAADVSRASLDQILKGTLLPKKQDGTRSPRSLGDTAARAIETAFDLGTGWFDAPVEAPAFEFDADTLEHAAVYAGLKPEERSKLKMLVHVARTGVLPTGRGFVNPNGGALPGDAPMQEGDSGLSGLDDLPPAKNKRPPA
jgi:hypothetical protein